MTFSDQEVGQVRTIRDTNQYLGGDGGGFAGGDGGGCRGGDGGGR